jgi:septal ring factor EnvC (AmiA/AmiB activator)
MLDHIEQLVAANKSMIKELKTCRMAQAVMDNTVAELEKENTRLSGLMSERGQMLRRYDQMVVDGAKREEAWKAKLAKAVEALGSIELYGSDTLSGRTDGPADAKWHREGVKEMRDRARAKLAEIGGLGVKQTG